MTDDDHAYFSQRAEAELKQAERATDNVAAQVHQRLAEAYRARASQPGADAEVNHPS